MPTTAREQDANGFLLVKGCPITSYGIFDYGAGQLGLPGDPNRIVKVFRPPEAVNDPEAIESFRDIPLIDDHEMLSGFQDDKETTAPEEYGVSGVLTSNVYFADPWMRGDLKVFSRDMQAALASGKKDLSLGYSCDFHMKAGSFQGQAYEVVQTNMRGNHIALVDEGRVPGARVLDARIFDHNVTTSNGVAHDVVSMQLHESIGVHFSTDGDPKMALKKGKALDNAVEQLKALLPALQQYLNQEGAEPEHQDAGANGGMGGTAGAEGAAVDPAADKDPAAPVSVKADPSAPVSVEHKSDPATGGDPASDPNAGDPAAGDPAASDPDAGGDPASADVGALISQVEDILGKLKAAMGGGQVGDDENADPALDSTQGLEDLQEVNKGEGGAVAADEESGKGAGAAEGNGKASPGPAAGVHSEASDAALQRFYADLADKTSLYDRLSPVIGAFDHKSMDSNSLAVYGVKKLKLNVAKGTEKVALDAFLKGRAAAKEVNKQTVQKFAADTAAVVSEMDAYLSGAK